MPVTPATPETLQSVVADLSAEEAKKRLLDFLHKNPEKARELIREKCKYRPDEKENAYLKSLRASLDRVIDELSSSIEGDEFTPYWDRLSLTNESSYVSEMKDLLQEAARKMPFGALVQLAVETDKAVREQTVFDWHPDPTESLWTLLRGVCIGTLEATPKKERAAVMETIEERFKEILPEDDLEYVMGPIREAAGQARPGRGRR